MNRDPYKRYSVLGPGGWKCACCTPAPPGKKRKPYLRIWKKRERRAMQRELDREPN